MSLISDDRFGFQNNCRFSTDICHLQKLPAVSEDGIKDR